MDDSKEKDYLTEDLVRLGDFLSIAWNAALALVELKSARLVYVTDCFAQLTGITNDAIEKEGKNIFFNYIDAKDLEILPKAFRCIESQFINNPSRKAIDVEVAFNLSLLQQEETKNYTFSFLINPKLHERSHNVVILSCKPEEKYGFEKYSVSVQATNQSLYYSSTAGKFVKREQVELKKTELDILRLIGAGHSENKVAKDLNIKIDLIRYYKKSIYKKLRVTNISEAIFIAYKCGLMQ